MYIERCSLKGFRNLSPTGIALSPGVNVLYGDNAQGKTNFLEAVYICSTGRSQRAHSDRELIGYAESDAYVQVFVKTRQLNKTDKIEVHLKKGDKKGIAVNGLPIKKMGQLFGNLLTVIFSPEDLQLIKSGPTERRRFMDVELCQLSAVYYHELQQYYHVLKQRNNLLKSIKAAPGLRETVAAWDEQLVKHGIKVIGYRQEFVSNMSRLAEQAHLKLTNGKERLVLIYRPNTLPDDFIDKLTRGLERDILIGSTSVGAHKDDISFMINNADARVYGSQGQQRTAALAAKLAEVELIRERKQISPVLLLDDVLSELDESRQLFLLESLVGIQAVITCTGADEIIKRLEHDGEQPLAVYRVENGNILEQG